MTKKEELQKAIDRLNEGLGLLEALKDSIQSAVDNWSGTAFENTERFQLYEQAASDLDDYYNTLEDAIGQLEGVEL
jgi:uncharacterized protein YukE